MKKIFIILFSFTFALTSCGSTHNIYNRGEYTNRVSTVPAYIGYIQDDLSLGKYNCSGIPTATFNGGYIISDQTGDIPLYTSVKLALNYYYSFDATSFVVNNSKYLSSLDNLKTIKFNNYAYPSPAVIYQDDLDSYFKTKAVIPQYSIIYGYYDSVSKILSPLYSNYKVYVSGQIDSLEDGYVALWGYPYSINESKTGLLFAVTSSRKIDRTFPESSYLGNNCVTRHDAIHFIDNFILSNSTQMSILIKYPYEGTINDEVNEISRGLETIGGIKIGMYEPAILDTYDFLTFVNEGLITDYGSVNSDISKTIPFYYNAVKDMAPSFNSRSEDFSNFAIDDLTNSVSVNTSEQLWYAVELGYKPIPVENSKAEKYYKIAKDLLRSICNDDMSAYQKVIAIYEYLSGNIYYDFDVLSKTDDWKQYASFYLEGVFDNHVAVCDGLSKAFVLLTGIEGIRSRRAFGRYENNTVYYSHAWNYVFIDESWSLVCTTQSHLNIDINKCSSNVTTYTPLFRTSFFFRKSKSSPYDDLLNSNIKILASKTINPLVYENKYYLDNDYQISLFVRDEDLLVTLLKKWNESNANRSTIEVDIYIDEITHENTIAKAVKNAGLDSSKIKKIQVDLDTFIFAKIA